MIVTHNDVVLNTDDDFAAMGVVTPGNGSRYVYIVWMHDHEWYAAFPDYHACSAVGVGPHHWSYIAEKMRVGKGDAEPMAEIIAAAMRLRSAERHPSGVQSDPSQPASSQRPSSSPASSVHPSEQASRWERGGADWWE